MHLLWKRIFLVRKSMRLLWRFPIDAFPQGKTIFSNAIVRLVWNDKMLLGVCPKNHTNFSEITYFPCEHT